MFDSAFQDGVKRPGTREMTALLAGLMALNAFAIDAMIPALPDIGRSLHVAQVAQQRRMKVSKNGGQTGQRALACGEQRVRKAVVLTRPHPTDLSTRERSSNHPPRKLS